VKALADEATAEHRKLSVAEAEVAHKRRTVAEMDDELKRLQSLMDTEHNALALLRSAREDHAKKIRNNPVMTAQISIEAELKAISEKHQAKIEEVAVTRKRIELLGGELSSERNRRDDLGKSLRKAVAEQAGDPARVQSLEATASMRCIDFVAALSRFRETNESAQHAEGVASGQTFDRAALLRSEVQTCEEQCATLRRSVESAEAKDAEDAARLQKELEEARDALQRSLRDAADAHGMEVAKLEDEVQAERHRASREVHAERECADRVAQLRAAKSRLEENKRKISSNAVVEAGVCDEIKGKVQSARDDVEKAKRQLQDAEEQADMVERQRAAAEEEGKERLAKVRGMLEDLWRGLKNQAMLQGVGGKPTSSSPFFPTLR